MISVVTASTVVVYSLLWAATAVAVLYPGVR
jgi:hypothetical protein